MKNNTQEQNKTKEMVKNISKEIFKKTFLLLLVIFILAFAETFSRYIVSFFKTDAKKLENKLNQEKMIDDILFVKTFETLNTTALKDYCSKTGYVPIDYIENIQKYLFKTFLNANKLFYIYFTDNIRKIYTKEFHKICIDNIEKDYNSLLSTHNISKKEYCEILNKERDVLIQEKIEFFKKEKPHLYLD